MHRVWLVLLLTTALVCRADNAILNAPSPADVQADVPAKPPVYQNETPTEKDRNEKEAKDSSKYVDRASSPDDEYFAALDVQQDPVAFWNDHLQRGILVVAHLPGGLSSVHDSPDLIHQYVRFEFPRFGQQLGWSPDSKYIVITTVDRGGHSPWHWLTLVYSTKTKTLCCLDPVSGDVIAPDFKFIAPHTVEIQVAPTSRDFAHPLTVDVDLEKKFTSMPKVGVRTEGTKVHAME